MNKITNKLPGKGMRILSFIPVFNCFALIYIGGVNSNTVNVLCGVGYFVISIAIPDASALFLDSVHNSLFDCLQRSEKADDEFHNDTYFLHKYSYI